MKQQLSPGTVVIIVIIVAIVAAAAVYYAVKKGGAKNPPQMTPEQLQRGMDKTKMQQGAMKSPGMEPRGGLQTGGPGASEGATTPAPAPSGGQ